MAPRQLDEAVEMEAKYVDLAKRLAGNVKKDRDAAVEDLKRWITGRPKDGYSELDMMKLWKGLFYCMWMSDKRPVQQELAEKLAILIHVFGSENESLLFIACFWKTMVREWHGVDYLRLDKYYFLFRRIQAHSVKFLQDSKWDSLLLERYADMLHTGPLRADRLHVPASLTYHLCENYLDLIEGFDGIPLHAQLHLCQPLFKLLVETDNVRVFSKADDGFFNALQNYDSIDSDALLSDLWNVASVDITSPNLHKIRKRIEMMAPTSSKVISQIKMKNPVIVKSDIVVLPTSKPLKKRVRQSENNDIPNTDSNVVLPTSKPLKKKVRQPETKDIPNSYSNFLIKVKKVKKLKSKKSEVTDQCEVVPANDEPLNPTQKSPSKSQLHVRWAKSKMVMPFNKFHPPIRVRPRSSHSE